MRIMFLNYRVSVVNFCLVAMLLNYLMACGGVGSGVGTGGGNGELASIHAGDNVGNAKIRVSLESRQTKWLTGRDNIVFVVVKNISQQAMSIKIIGHYLGGDRFVEKGITYVGGGKLLSGEKFQEGKEVIIQEPPGGVRLLAGDELKIAINITDTTWMEAKSSVINYRPIFNIIRTGRYFFYIALNVVEVIDDGSENVETVESNSIVIDVVAKK
ncbi:MAG: hypothetical protein OEV59_05745 [Deltaproteobacteria bacterium]|nr:hypothetical protein [Deltaproteobacteria bacterium]